MRHNSRRARLILVVLAIGLVAIGTAVWEPLYWWATSRRIFVEDSTAETGAFSDPLTGGARVEYPAWRTYGVARWSAKKELHGRVVVYYKPNGFLAESSLHRNGIWIRGTYWRIDGAVNYQFRNSGENIQRKKSPPWWWNVTAQTEPTAPWWRGGK